jgi:hypothetical protein
MMMMGEQQNGRGEEVGRRRKWKESRTIEERRAATDNSERILLDVY